MHTDADTDNRPLRVLVVEDDEDDYIITRDLLSEIDSRRIDPDRAATFDAALERIAANQYDVYLLDYRLGARDGLELMSEAIAIGCTAPMILLTGQADHEVDLEAMKAGATDYLVKGQIDAALLERSIRYAIERKQAEDALQKAHNELEMRVRQRTAELSHANAALNTEITEHKRAKERISHLIRQNELILNSAGEGIFGLDQEGKFTFVNTAAAKMIGWEAHKVVGQRQHDIVPFSKSDGSACPWEDSAIGATLKDGKECRVNDGVLCGKDGSNFPVEYTSAPMRDEWGELVGAVVVFRDITERRAVDRMKDEFVSLVSHELRTPLTSIRGSLLDIERMESGIATMEKTSCDVAELMTQAAEVMQDMAQKAGVALTVGAVEVRLWADPDRIIQTLTNLLSNAIKFSPSGGTVRMTNQRQGHSVLIQVSDEGRGIPSDKLEHVFERFQQVDGSDSRQKGGTGLGLAICRSIVQQHGGHIWADSGLKNGTTFSVALPTLLDQ